MISSRMPFTFNTMVLLPLLRSLPASGALSLVMVLISMTGLDVGLLRLGRPETAADIVVAWMMSISAATPALWGVYMVSNAWTWVTGLRGVGARRSQVREAPAVKAAPRDISPQPEGSPEGQLP